ncbi:MAG: D-tyrosyl-tRNA(Tyr) deacylase [Desulfovibrionaceae bacterium]|nr:D-tyrosyl-tRNA(Tyr) deacylase [Desulfovibrionaceae bacterium]
MRLVIQRVSRAGVEVDGREVAGIGPGLVVLVGFGSGDDQDLPGSAAWAKMIEKTLDLRVFPDETGRLDKSLRDIGGDLLAVSQFTLYADCRKGRRPSFSRACPPDVAAGLFSRFVDDIRAAAPGRTASGLFGALMALDLVNQGPVTIILDSADFQ